MNPKSRFALKEAEDVVSTSIRNTQEEWTDTGYAASTAWSLMNKNNQLQDDDNADKRQAKFTKSSLLSRWNSDLGLITHIHEYLHVKDLGPYLWTKIFNVVNIRV